MVVIDVGENVGAFVVGVLEGTPDHFESFFLHAPLFVLVVDSGEKK